MEPAPPTREAERAANPYLGPRPFTQDDADRFFGREREVSELYSLVAAHRTVLLYAQSGAGKTSLLNAGLIPMLESGGFDALPTARVSGRSEHALAKLRVENVNIDNVYVSSCIGTWAEDNTRINSSLSTALAYRRRREDAKGQTLPRVAIFDQFEELFTAYPKRWQERKGFFEQLAEAMEVDPSLRVLFAMREDFVARIDPYEELLPEELRTRYRLEQLREDAALEAVEKPLAGTGIAFRPGVAKSLAEDLMRTVSTSIEAPVHQEVSPASEDQLPRAHARGEYVEPVQLQVVCFSLFRNLPEGTTEITREHLATFGDVDQALQDFYQSALKEAAGKAAIDEDSLRRWFESELITEAGTRGLVFRGEKAAGGIPNATVDALEELHIIRAEARGGDRWYELSHDRFIQPILTANQEWRKRVEIRER